MAVNGHAGGAGSEHSHGIQIVDEKQAFNAELSKYLSKEHVLPVGFNYHLISVFGSQSTGKSTLLNHLFGTDFGVMFEDERRQTTKGIWMSKNRRERADGGLQAMAENILVMDVEGTDGRERGEDQDFERKSALFALATSEVLIVNIWEHQVGLYHGANMGLLKVVFEVNLELFLKDKRSNPRSLLFFVIRDHLGTTPLSNLRNTLVQDLQRIWAGLNKPAGLEKSKIEDYFDFAFSALPHKILQPERFVSEVAKLGTRFKNGARELKQAGQELDGAVFLPEYSRHIPADGFSIYAEQVWDQIVNNKDLDLPTQQELMAQFRCDEISREVLEVFDEVIIPYETKQIEGIRMGAPQVLSGMGSAMRLARTKVLNDFDNEASRYHKGVYARKKSELEAKVDTRLKILFDNQLVAAQKDGVRDFAAAVSLTVKDGQKKANYDFADIVGREKAQSITKFEEIAQACIIEGASWSAYKELLVVYTKELDEVSARLRREEIRRLATRVERWIKSRLGESIGLEFSHISSSRPSSTVDTQGNDEGPEGEIWDRVWRVFVKTVKEAEKRFADRATSFDASAGEVEVGLWRLRRKAWTVLRAKIDEEMLEGNLLMKLRENFEDKFRYDEAGVPRIWRPTDDIEGTYTKARESTLLLIPLLSKFQSSRTSAPPPLDIWIGPTPSETLPADEEDLVPIGGVDEEEGKSLEEEITLLPETKRKDITARFKKVADGVYVEAKRSAVGGITQVPLYFYVLLLILGWNEILAVLRNPIYFVSLLMLGAGAYVTHTLNLWGPMMNMAGAASSQALEEGKKRLREFLESNETARQAIGMNEQEAVPLKVVNGEVASRKRAAQVEDEEDDADI